MVRTWVSRRKKKASQEDPQNLPEGPPWEEVEGECFAPYELYSCVNASAFQARENFLIFCQTMKPAGSKPAIFRIFKKSKIKIFN